METMAGMQCLNIGSSSQENGGSILAMTFRGTTVHVVEFEGSVISGSAGPAPCPWNCSRDIGKPLARAPACKPCALQAHGPAARHRAKGCRTAAPNEVWRRGRNPSVKLNLSGNLPVTRQMLAVKWLKTEGSNDIDDYDTAG